MRKSRTIQTTSLSARLVLHAQGLRDRAEKLKPGAKRDRLLRRALMLKNGSQIEAWLSPPVLAVPK